jgi:hypothetical protein
MSSIINATTSSGLTITPDNSGQIQFQINGSNSLSLTSTGVSGVIYSANNGIATPAIGANVNFTNIPSWVKRITVMFNGISTDGSSLMQIQLGDSGGIEITGYSGAAGWFGSTNASASSGMSSGFLITAAGDSGFTGSGMAIITLLGTNTWVMQSTIGRYDQNFVHSAAGSKTLSDTLDRIRITTANGTDTFDTGSINLLYEG